MRDVKNHLEGENDRQLFLGNGLIVGSFRRQQTRKYVTAPLIYFLVEIDLDENGRSLTSNIEWNSASLNYDLITPILEQDFEEEDDDDEGIGSQSAGIGANQLEVLEDIENNLEDTLRYESERLMTGALAVQTFQQIHERIPEFNQVAFSTEEFTLQKLENLGSNEEVNLTFYNHRFFYVASLPGQLSTYTALRKLIIEVS